MAGFAAGAEDPALLEAARALREGDAISALARVGFRDDTRSLAIRGVAMAQMGESARARELLHRAADRFAREGSDLDRARTLAALAELSMAERDLVVARRSLEDALDLLQKRYFSG